MHLVHRAQHAVERDDIEPQALTNELPAPAHDRMDMQIGLWTRANGSQVASFKRNLERRAHQLLIAPLAP